MTAAWARLACLLALGACAAGAPAAERTPADLAWGEVLYHHFLEDWFGGLVRLDLAQSRGQLEGHADEGRLLEGGLYLAWGARDRAARIFESVAGSGTDAARRDRAWYWLARVRHERGDPAGAAEALARIGDGLPEGWVADRVDLEARVLMALDRHREAAGLLAQRRLPGAWQSFADFNRAVSLLRAGQAEEGLGLLDALGRAPATTPETALVRDRANLALGLALLEAGDFGPARAALDRVRLEGPYSGRALLAAGWAEAGRDDLRAALGPWSVLAGRPDPDGAALEAGLAVPWAWQRLGAAGESAAGYERAETALGRELSRLEAAAGEAGGETLVRLALAGDAPAGDESALAAYLYGVSADHPFRAAASDLRDLDAMAANLGRWQDSLGAFRHMVEARRERFAGIAPRARAALEGDRLSGLAGRQAAAEERLAAIRASRDPAGLATAAERATLARLAALGARIAALPAEEAGPLAARVARLEGRMAWELNAAWPARLRALEKQVVQSARLLEEARRREASLAEALAAGPAGFDGFAARIDALEGQVDALLGRTAEATAARTGGLRAMVLDELAERRQRVAAYLGQARFALAAAHDNAFAGGGAPAGEARP